jgi:polyhydroxyalkanoate synthase subunit PhaC
MGAAFSWVRPDDLIFNYWVNNYLMGEQPPAFDILAWNADGTNLPGALHCQLLDIFQYNLLAVPGAMTVLGTPPANPKARYWTGDPPGPDPGAWLAGAQEHQGSWWQPWADWITQRSGDQRRAGQHLGSEGHNILDHAPGRYVRD